MAKKRPRYSEWLSAGVGSEHVPPDGYRTTAVDAPPNYITLLDAMRSKAPGQWSQNILELSNHFTSAAFLAINTIANQAAASERKVYERTYDTKEADIELSWSEPLCRLLDQPNDEDDWGDLMYQISQQISLTGLALIWKPNDSPESTPRELYVLPTAACLPWPASPEFPNGSYLVQPYYPYGPFSTVPSYQSAAGARIPAEQVIRIKNPHPILRYDGYAVLTAMRRQVDTIDSIDAARWSTQQRGVDSSLVMQFDPKVYNPENQPDLNRLRVQLDAMYSGPTNAGRIMPAPVGTTLSKVSNNPSEMAWQEGWDQLVKFTMAAYGCPSVIAGMSDASSYATLYASLQQFELISMNPHLRRIGSQFNSGLVKPYYGQNLYLQLNARKITDEEMELSKLDLGLRAAAIKKNEVRKALDLDPLEGDEGDQLCGDLKESMRVDGGVADAAGDVEPHQNPGDDDATNNRPDNVVAERATHKSIKANTERMAEIVDRMKHRGVITPLNGEQREYFHDFATRG